MRVLLGGIGLNIFLNWVFIFGKLGAPAMGLVGAGLATLIARFAIMCAIYSPPTLKLIPNNPCKFHFTLSLVEANTWLQWLEKNPSSFRSGSHAWLRLLSIPPGAGLGKASNPRRLVR